MSHPTTPLTLSRHASTGGTTTHTGQQIDGGGSNTPTNARLRPRPQLSISSGIVTNTNDSLSSSQPSSPLPPRMRGTHASPLEPLSPAVLGGLKQPSRRNMVTSPSSTALTASSNNSGVSSPVIHSASHQSNWQNTPSPMTLSTGAMNTPQMQPQQHQLQSRNSQSPALPQPPSATSFDLRARSGSFAALPPLGSTLDQPGYFDLDSEVQEVLTPSKRRQHRAASPRPAGSPCRSPPPNLTPRARSPCPPSSLSMNIAVAATPERIVSPRESAARFVVSPLSSPSAALSSSTAESQQLHPHPPSSFTFSHSKSFRSPLQSPTASTSSLPIYTPPEDAIDRFAAASPIQGSQNLSASSVERDEFNSVSGATDQDSINPQYLTSQLSSFALDVRSPRTVLTSRLNPSGASNSAVASSSSSTAATASSPPQLSSSLPSSTLTSRSIFQHKRSSSINFVEETQQQQQPHDQSPIHATVESSSSVAAVSVGTAATAGPLTPNRRPFSTRLSSSFEVPGFSGLAAAAAGRASPTSANSLKGAAVVSVHTHSPSPPVSSPITSLSPTNLAVASGAQIIGSSTSATTTSPTADPTSSTSPSHYSSRMSLPPNAAASFARYTSSNASATASTKTTSPSNAINTASPRGNTSMTSSSPRAGMPMQLSPRSPPQRTRSRPRSNIIAATLSS